MTARTTVFIEPSDVWLFRNARPFTAAEQARATSLFPPSPRTIQGALRSARLAASGESWDYRRWSTALRAEIGQPDDFGALRCRGPLLARRRDGMAEPLFPMPFDILKLRHRGWLVLSPRAGERIVANWPEQLVPLLPPDDDEPEKFEPQWLPRNVLLSYLSQPAAPLPAIDFASSETLFRFEPRFGVEVDSHVKRPREGMLFQIEFIRMGPDTGLLIEFSGVTLPESGLLQLGGEARAAQYVTVHPVVDVPRTGRLRPTTGRLQFKLYIATPAIFSGGWRPGALDAATLQGKWNGVDVQLIAAAIGKPVPVGGRDIARGDSQRAIRRAVPAGSVYFFEADRSPQDVFDAFDGQCLSDVDAQIGFGLSYVGGW